MSIVLGALESRPDLTRPGRRSAKRDQPGALPVRPNPRVLGRNDICPCAENIGIFDSETGKPKGGREKSLKFKHCCLRKPIRVPAGFAAKATPQPAGEGS